VAPVDDAARIAARSRQAHLLLVDGDHDLREALAPHAAAVVEFLRTACGSGAASLALAAAPDPAHPAG